MSSSAHTSPDSKQSTASSIDSLTCQWAGCSEKCTSAEALYDHVCERHVGRKSTNNLNLQCQWAQCRIVTVKRDHITSHIRVHVPLKPHKCDFCGKTFKRPQDLKKHVKTHADESVLLRSPEPIMNSNSSRPQHSAHASQSHNYAHQVNMKTGYYADTSFYGANSSTPNYGYINSHSNGMQCPTTASSGPSYGPVYTTAPQQASFGGSGSGSSMGGSGLTESRKREFDAMNDLFRAIKRQQINPHSYVDIGAQFGSLVNVGHPSGPSLAVDAGYMGDTMAAPAPRIMVNENMNAGGGGGTALMTAQHPPGFQSNYNMAPAFPELRTKQDLQMVDHFLEQLQGTIYETPDFGFQNRLSQSPPVNHTDALNGTGLSNNSMYNVAPSVEDIPGLTPSYPLSHSPSIDSASVYSQTPPASRPMGTNLYPHLPSVSGSLSPMSPSAPLSGLGSDYEDNRRRYSNGFLQKAAPPRMSPPKSYAAPPAAEQSKALGSNPATGKMPNEVTRLPGVASITSRRSSTSSNQSIADRREEAYVHNMATVEALRAYISKRLERGDFETAASSRDTEMTDRDAATTPKPMYPALRPVGA